MKPFGYAPKPERERSQPGGESDGTWDDVKAAALANLDAWVPHLGIDAKRQGSSWRGKAIWKGAENANVSFHSKGIKDWGDDRGMTAIDVVMLALDMDFGDAVDWLKGKLGVLDLPRLNLVFRKKHTNTTARPATEKRDPSTRLPWSTSEAHPRREMQ